MKPAQEQDKLSLYLSDELREQLDAQKGPLSRNKLIVLILQQAVKNGVDLGSLVTGGS
jgi:hypothetical protein